MWVANIEEQKRIDNRMSFYRAGTRRAKRQGTIEPPRGLIKTIREKVIVEPLIKNKLRKKVMIITTFECETSITINIGNTEIYCIDCTIIKNNTGIYNTGILTKARWDIDCSIGDPFEKGDDSIIIIKLLLTYIKDRYPSVTELLFTDMSTKTCDDGSSVNLAAMKVFTDGKTWYETHFDVKMDKQYQDLYNNMKNYANEKKLSMTFDGFMGYININNIPIDNKLMRIQYENSKNWQDFFSYIRNNIGVSQYCIWLSKTGWFDNFTNAVLKFHTLSIQFIFEPKKYDISYKILNSFGGKYRITKKNKH
jgi:hypothetical protein